MEEIIQQILFDIDGIKTSLETISNNGIPIVDTFAPITTGVNMLVTVFATAFGGWITLKLFKRQEKMRIKEELKLNFYNGYKVHYNQLFKLISTLRTQVKVLYEMSLTCDYSVYRVNNGNKIKLMYENQKIAVENINSLIKKLDDKMKCLIEYLENNEIVLSEYSGDLFESENDFVFCISANMFLLQCTYNSMDQINLGNEKIDEDYINELLENNQKYFDELLKLDDKKFDNICISNLLGNMRIINYKIEQEFIGKYF